MNSKIHWAPYFCSMQLSHEHQELVDFFADCELPSGPQHVNEYSVFLNLPRAVSTHLPRLSSEVEATRKSAAALLAEVRDWVMERGDLCVSDGTAVKHFT